MLKTGFPTDTRRRQNAAVVSLLRGPNSEEGALYQPTAERMNKLLALNGSIYHLAGKLRGKQFNKIIGILSQVSITADSNMGGAGFK